MVPRVLTVVECCMTLFVRHLRFIGRQNLNALDAAALSRLHEGRKALPLPVVACRRCAGVLRSECPHTVRLVPEHRLEERRASVLAHDRHVSLVLKKSVDGPDITVLGGVIDRSPAIRVYLTTLTWRQQLDSLGVPKIRSDHEGGLLLVGRLPSDVSGVLSDEPLHNIVFARSNRVHKSSDSLGLRCRFHERGWGWDRGWCAPLYNYLCHPFWQWCGNPVDYLIIGKHDAVRRRITVVAGECVGRCLIVHLIVIALSARVSIGIRLWRRRLHPHNLRDVHDALCRGTAIIAIRGVVGGLIVGTLVGIIHRGIHIHLGRWCRDPCNHFLADSAPGVGGCVDCRIWTRSVKPVPLPWVVVIEGNRVHIVRIQGEDRGVVGHRGHCLRDRPGEADCHPRVLQAARFDLVRRLGD
eukprot:XP_001707033.1 Hypothetical protein GL50803_93253 [Giardia lamblia ATCC 50803]